ncbi:MAG: hypothetical protein BroJett013_30570 [Alphaproteobacteria bacterium]|nr:MAG: hypothetical protein BroJett013_30570 [Alphaproteobacteria bacterium]
MARMPDQLPSMRAPRGGGGARMPGVDVSSGTRALAGAMEEIAAGLTERRLRARDQDDRVALAAASTRFRQAQIERLMREGDELADDAVDGFADRYEATARAAADAEIAALPERLQDRAQIELQQAAADLRLRAFDVEHERRRARQTRLLDGVVRGEGAIVFADASQYEAALERTQAALDNSGLGQAQQAQIAAALPRSLANWRLLGLIDRAPSTALGELQGGQWNGVLEVEEIDRHMGAARREIARREAEAERRRQAWLQREQARLRVVMEDDLASIQATGRGVGLALSEVERAYGAELAEAYAGRRRFAEETHDRLSRWRFMAPAEIAAEVQSLAPRPGQQGFAAAQERHAAFQQAAQGVIESRARDPAQAALAADPALEQAMEDIADPQTSVAQRRIFIGQLLDRQERLGVPASGRRLTTIDQAAAWAGRIRGAGPADRARAIEEVVGQAAAIYGAHSGQALAEVARTAELPELAAIAAIPDLEERRRAARAMAGPEPELQAGARRSMRARLDNEFAPLARTLADTPGGGERLAAARAAAERIAAADIVAGVRPEDAARSAAQIYTGQYQFRAGLRLPRTWRGEALNARAVIEAADRRLEEIADAGAFVLPAGRGDVSDADQARAARDSFRLAARWISAPNDQGLLLVDEYGDAIEGADGAAIAASWDELRRIAARRNEERRDVGAPVDSGARMPRG